MEAMEVMVTDITDPDHRITSDREDSGRVAVIITVQDLPWISAGLAYLCRPLKDSYFPLISSEHH